LKYCIESDYNKVTIQLEPKNSLHYMNVPLAKALLHHEQTVYPEGCRPFNVSWQAGQEGTRGNPVASYTIPHEDRGNEEKIKAVHGQAQLWLGREITRLEKLKDDLDTLKEAEYATGNASS
jgi:hypothetical protein